MKITGKAISLSIMIIFAAMTHAAFAADPAAPNALAPVSVFSAKDIPEVEPGKPAWLTGEGYAVAYYDKWVYAASKALYILKFERDPATAKLTYKDATPFGGEGDHNVRVAWLCCRVLVKDGNAILVVRHGSEAEHVNCYAIDKDNGKLTLVEKPKTKSKNYNLLNDMMYMNSSYYHSGDDGVPFLDGKFPTRHPLDHHPAPPIFSPDGRQMYYVWHQTVVDPKNPVNASNDKAPLIETYDIDPKTHVGVYNSSLELPFLGTPKTHVSAAHGVFSPDGKHLYFFFCAGHDEIGYYYVLARDPQSGALSIASQQATPNDLKRVFGYSAWDGVSRRAFSNDGRRLYFVADLKSGSVGCFARDPDSGILTVLPPLVELGARRMAFDPINGNLFTVGEKIASFKIPSPELASGVK